MSWYLVSVRPNKRDLFLKYLNITINNNQLQNLFLEIVAPTDPIYKDMVLLHLEDLKTARSHLQLIEHFQKIEPRPLPPEQISRILSS